MPAKLTETNLLDMLPQWKREAAIRALDGPQFEGALRCYDWRNHVPEGIRRVWDRLPDTARLVAVIMAESAADAEEWDF